MSISFFSLYSLSIIHWSFHRSFHTSSILSLLPSFLPSFSPFFMRCSEHLLNAKHCSELQKEFWQTHASPRVVYILEREGKWETRKQIHKERKLQIMLRAIEKRKLSNGSEWECFREDGGEGPSYRRSDVWASTWKYSYNSGFLRLLSLSIADTWD